MSKSKVFVPLAVAGAVFAGSSVGVAPPAQAQDCTYTIGAVLSLTGSYGAFGVPISKAAELAVEQVSEAVGDSGCTFKYDVRDSQTQASVAVDAARKLIDLNGVTAIVGPVSSGITAPLLTSATIEKDVLVIATASTSSTFTEMGRRGETKGLFFRTLPADSLQAVATAKMAWDVGLRKIAIINLNNDWGNNNVAEFVRSFEALGGGIGNIVPYNADQATYRSEVNKALQGDPDSLYLLSAPQDGTKIFRDWLRLEGPTKYVFPQGMNDSAFVDTIGAEFFTDAWFISPGSPDTPSLAQMEADYQARWDLSPKGPGRTSGYDSGALIALAMISAGGETNGTTLAKHVRLITGKEGEPIYAGVEEFKKAIKLLGEGKMIRYVGATGPIDFDEYGDVSVPFVGMQIRDGDFQNVMEITLADVQKIKELTQ